MKRLPIVALIGALFLAVPLLAPISAVAHPGKTCDPPAGHGSSGCHRVTASKPKATAKPKPKVATVRPKTVVKKAAAPVAAPVVTSIVEPLPSITDAELGAAFYGTQPGYGGRGDR
jgi:hypothetical protein